MPDTPAAIGTVVVSAVRHARGYARALAERADFRLVAVAESQSADAAAWADARELAGALGVPILPMEELSPQDAELTLICSEPTRHAALAEAMLLRGFDVLCDKPLATTGRDARRVAQAAQQAGRRCAVVTRALTPAVRRARELVDSGRLGLPRSIDLEFLSAGTHLGSAVERLELVVDPRLSGGGEIMNFLGYPLEIIRAVTGCEPVEAFAEAGSLFFPEHAAAGVEDVAVVSLLFTNGLVASILVGRVPVAPGRRPFAGTARIVGSHGHVEFDLDGPAVTIDRAEDSSRLRLDRGAFETVLDGLSASIRTATPLPFDAADAAAAVEAIDAVYRSTATGLPVAVERPGSLDTSPSAANIANGTMSSGK